MSEGRVEPDTLRPVAPRFAELSAAMLSAAVLSDAVESDRRTSTSALAAQAHGTD
jgi:hypothetical protein